MALTHVRRQVNARPRPCGPSGLQPRHSSGGAGDPPMKGDLVGMPAAPTSSRLCIGIAFLLLSYGEDRPGMRSR